MKIPFFHRRGMSSDMKLVYTLTNIGLILLELKHTTTTLHDTDATSRIVLQLLTSLSLLSSIYISPSATSLQHRRFPILSCFVIALTLIIDSILRLLSTIQSVFYNRTPNVIQTPIILIVAHFILDTSFLLSTFNALSSANVHHLHPFSLISSSTSSTAATAAILSQQQQKQTNNSNNNNNNTNNTNNNTNNNNTNSNSNNDTNSKKNIKDNNNTNTNNQSNSLNSPPTNSTSLPSSPLTISISTNNTNTNYPSLHTTPSLSTNQSAGKTTNTSSSAPSSPSPTTTPSLNSTPARINSNIKVLNTPVCDTTTALRCYAINSFILYMTTFIMYYVTLEPIQSLSILLCFMSISCTLCVAYPVLMEAARVLLQAAPPNCVHAIRRSRDAIIAIDGVVECSNLHVWEESSGVVVGTLSIHVHPAVSKAAVLKKTNAAFQGLVDDLTVQVESWHSS